MADGTRLKPNSELQKLNDPNFLVELALGPPNPALVPQQAGTGVKLGEQYSNRPRSFVFKKAHLSLDDTRIFNGETGEVLLVTHHPGKDPYQSLDPLGLVPDDNFWSPFGEWQSMCHATGYHGMCSFRVRPKSFTRHGRQYVQDADGETSYFNIAKQSRIKSMSIRHNLCVCYGDSKEVAYRILADIAGRTMQIVNEKDQLVAIVTKSVKNLILNASFGAGSELQIDVAPGVDWTAMLAILIGLKQVGQHYAKDAVNNFVVNPAISTATGFGIGQIQSAVADPDSVAQTFEGATSVVGDFGDGLGETLEGAADGLGDVVEGASDGMGEVLGAVMEFVTGLFQ